MILTIAVLATSLSLDALGVGVAYGLRRVRIPLTSKFIICFFSMLYSALSILIGTSLSAILPVFMSKIIGVSILFLMGTWVILHNLLKKDDAKNSSAGAEEAGSADRTLVKIAIKSLGITIQVIKNPAVGDIDHSGTIDIPESLLLGLALSVDAIGAGIGSALAGMQSMLIPVFVGLFQMAFLYAGSFFGNKFAMLEKVNKRLLELAPGILLIGLSLIRLY